MIARIAAAARGFALPRFSAPRPDAAARPAAPGRRTLRVYFIKPSRYDDDGEVLQFRWGVIPNNTLTVLAGIHRAHAAARPEIDVQTVLWDELVDGAISGATANGIAGRGRADGVEVVIGLAGVQSNQYPRARDLGLQFRALGLPVLIGGFHASSHEPSRAFLESVGISVVVGEAETTWGRVLDDLLRGDLAPEYRVTDGVRAKTGFATDVEVPLIDAAPLPAIDPRYLSRFFNPTFSTLDTSRGCPFVCSYCSVKNVVGRTMRARDPDAVIDWMRAAHDEHGVRNLLVVDDDFFRSPHWEPILAGLVRLRREGRGIAFVIQTDVEASLHADGTAAAAGHPRHEHCRRFVELAAAAGCFEVFIGLESFEPRNLDGTAKRQNSDKRDRGRGAADPDGARRRVKDRYRRAVENWHRAGVAVHCGYIIGLPFDAPGCGARAARDLAEIGVDLASFFAYTPLPGTEDRVELEAGGHLPIDDDFNDYDSTHFVARHPTLGRAELEREYRDAWRSFYSWRRLVRSLATLHRVPGLSLATRLAMATQQGYFTWTERRGRHPMMGGIWRVRGHGVRREVVGDGEAASRWLPAPGSGVHPTVPRRGCDVRPTAHEIPRLA